jgi:hypothetical protein
MTLLSAQRQIATNWISCTGACSASGQPAELHLLLAFRCRRLRAGASACPDARHVYWSNGLDAIGRADLNGQNVNPSFISGASETGAVAVDATHVYWVNLGTGTIARAELSGQNAKQTIISGVPNGTGVDVG